MQPSMDDFGTGYSAWPTSSTADRRPNIDRSFVTV